MKSWRCWCECKEVDDWGYCKNDYMSNPSMCDCECNKACKIGKYLNTKNCLLKKVYLVK